MKNALEAYKIRIQWHLRRCKKIIGIYDKILALKIHIFQKDIIPMNKENGGMISMFKKMKRFLKAAFTIVLCLVELIEIFADTSAKSFA